MIPTKHIPPRVWLLAQPARVIIRCQYDRHAVMDFGNESVGIGRDDRKGTHPFARRRLLPVLPDTGDSERRAVLHCDSVGLLRLLPFDRFPFEESVHRQDAAASTVSIAEGR